MCRHVGTTLVGQLKQLDRVALRRPDQALVRKLGEGRVHRTGTRPPATAGALLDRLHELVAVARLVGEQHEERAADLAAPAPSAATAEAAWAEAEAAWAGAVPAMAARRRGLGPPPGPWPPPRSESS